MIGLAVLSASDQFHREVRHYAAEAGIRVELVLRSVAALGSGHGLDVIIVHRPGGDDLESIKDAVGSLPIVVAGPSAIDPDRLRTQEGWAILPDDDIPVLLAAARAAAFGLSVAPADRSESGPDEDDDLGLTPTLRRSPGAAAGRLSLTAREIDVLNLVASGATNRAIGVSLGISDNTVKYHLAGLYAKMNVARRSEVIFEAMRRGLITI